MPLHSMLEPACWPEGPRRPQYIPQPVNCRLSAGCSIHPSPVPKPTGAIECASAVRPRNWLRQRAEHTNDHRTRQMPNKNEARNKPAEPIGLLLLRVASVIRSVGRVNLFVSLLRVGCPKTQHLRIVQCVIVLPSGRRSVTKWGSDGLNIGRLGTVAPRP